MKVEFGGKFTKELQKVKEPKIRDSLLKFIEEVKEAQTLSDLKKMKKLKGYKHFYRARLGEYRVGLIYEEGTISFETILHRKDIYKKFP